LQILDAVSAGTVEQVSSSEESSDGDDDNPLSYLIAARPSVHPPVCPPLRPPVSPPRAELLPVLSTRDFSDDDEEEDPTSVEELLSKAINTISGTTNVSLHCLIVLRRHTMLRL